MKRLRIRVIILAVWLLFFFVIDRLLDPLAISNATITLVFVTAIASLVMHRRLGISLWIIAMIPIIALFIIKLLAGQLSGDLGISLAIIEACILLLTAILSRWISRALSEFEDYVTQITLGRPEKAPETSIAGQGSIYREVRRARNHQRPLALISIGVDENSIEPAVEKMVQEIQLAMMKQYKLQGLSKMLCDELDDCSVIVRDSDKFLVVLPETLPDELPVVIDRLSQKARAQVGINIKIGVATLPQDGYTFEGLLDKANRIMQQSIEPESGIHVSQYPVEDRVSG